MHIFPAFKMDSYLLKLHTFQVITQAEHHQSQLCQLVPLFQVNQKLKVSG